MTVDLTKAIPPGLMAIPQAVAAVSRDLAEAVRNEIIRLAHEELGTSTEDFVQGVMPVEHHALPPGGIDREVIIATIVLVGWLPNAIENGWAGGDMKPALLSGRNARVSKDGLSVYNTVPFRHGTPGTTGRNFQAMGQGYAASFVIKPGGGAVQHGSLGREEAARLGRRVHGAAKRLAATTSHADSGTKWGGRLAAGVGGVGKARPHHKTDLHAGMVRHAKTYRSATQSSYGTFRRVSTNSDPSAFVHPGIEGHRLFEAGGRYLDEIAPHLFGTAVDNVVRERA